MKRLVVALITLALSALVGAAQTVDSPLVALPQKVMLRPETFEGQVVKFDYGAIQGIHKSNGEFFIKFEDQYSKKSFSWLLTVDSVPLKASADLADRIDTAKTLISPDPARSAYAMVTGIVRSVKKFNTTYYYVDVFKVEFMSVGTNGGGITRTVTKILEDKGLLASLTMDDVKRPSGPGSGTGASPNQPMGAKAPTGKGPTARSISSLLEVGSDMPSFIGVPVKAEVEIAISTYYNYGYRDAQATHHSFEIVDASLPSGGYVFMVKGEKSNWLRDQLLKTGPQSKLKATVVFVILGSRFEANRWQTQLLAELLDVTPPEQ